MRDGGWAGIGGRKGGAEWEMLATKGCDGWDGWRKRRKTVTFEEMEKMPILTS